MYHKFCIFIGRLVVLAGIIFRRGSALPGVIALKLDKNIMQAFTLPKIVIAVTGSSGKGSISSLLAKICEDQGYRVAHNKVGSNLTPGIVTLLLEHTNFRGKIKSDILLYEIDERYTKYVFGSITPNYVVISNITRDQPPRQGHFDLVFEDIKQAINDSMHLILNADDPYLQKFVINRKNPVTYYGINKNKYSYIKNKFENLNSNYCPKCNEKLEYEYYNFENTGNYNCSKCTFKRPTATHMATSIQYDKSMMTIDHEYQVQIPYNVLYAVYNTLAAFTTASLLKLNPNRIINSIETYHKSKKIFDVYEYNHRVVTVLNNKNENSSTFNQSLLYLNRFHEEKTVVIGWKEISRRYHFDDLSWLYDIDFELLKKLNIHKIVCVGIHRYDIATRLKYAGLDEKQIVVFDDLEKSISYVKEKTKGNIYAILNFDYVNPFHTFMKEGEK